MYSGKLVIININNENLSKNLCRVFKFRQKDVGINFRKKSLKKIVKGQVYTISLNQKR